MPVQQNKPEPGDDPRNPKLSRSNNNGIKDSLLPCGNHGKESLPVNVTLDGVTSCGYAKGAGAGLDWYNDKLQVLVFDHSEDPAIHVRLNADGTVAEILVRDDLMQLIKHESGGASDWQKKRDHESA